MQDIKNFLVVASRPDSLPFNSVRLSSTMKPTLIGLIVSLHHQSEHMLHARLGIRLWVRSADL